MKRIKIIFLTIIFCLFLIGCSSEKNDNNLDNDFSDSNYEMTNSNNLIVYFSYSGNTKSVCDVLNKKITSDIIEIKPEVLYTKEDVNYNNSNSRALLERRNNARPAISNGTYNLINLSNYDNVFIAYPIWNGFCPMIIKTFIEYQHNHLIDKNIYTISTSASSSGANAFNELKNNYSDLNFIDYVHFTSSTLTDADNAFDKKINNWSLKLDNRKIVISFGDNEIHAMLQKNTPADDLLKRLDDNEITLEFSDFASSEKIAYPNPLLNILDEGGCEPEIGDIAIYKPWNNIAIFYNKTVSFSNDLVLIGKIDKDDISKITNIKGKVIIKKDINK